MQVRDKKAGSSLGSEAVSKELCESGLQQVEEWFGERLVWRLRSSWEDLECQFFYSANNIVRDTLLSSAEVGRLAVSLSQPGAGDGDITKGHLL